MDDARGPMLKRRRLRKEARALLGEAGRLLADGAHEEAFNRAARSLELVREANDRELEWLSLVAMGEVRRAQERIPESVEHLERALMIARAEGDGMQVVLTLVALAGTYKQGRQPEEAQELVSRAKTRASMVDGELERGRILLAAGDELRELGLEGDAQECYRQAIPGLYQVANRRSAPTATIIRVGDPAVQAQKVLVEIEQRLTVLAETDNAVETQEESDGHQEG